MSRGSQKLYCCFYVVRSLLCVFVCAFFLAFDIYYDLFVFLFSVSRLVFLFCFALFSQFFISIFSNRQSTHTHTLHINALWTVRTDETRPIYVLNPRHRHRCCRHRNVFSFTETERKQSGAKREEKTKTVPLHRVIMYIYLVQNVTACQAMVTLRCHCW